MATRKASNKVENAVARMDPVAARGLRRPHRLDLGAARLRGGGGLPARTTAPAASSTTGSASTSRRRSRTGSRCRSCGRCGRPTSPSPTTRAGDPAVGADGAAGDPPLHPRLDRARRGRAHPPAGRAARGAARDPGPQRDPARDANEVAEAWRVAVDRTHQPVALVLTRQDVPMLDRSRYAPAEGLRRGGYVLADPADGDPEVILIATGSEVALAAAAYEELTADGIRARVVSLPSWYLFDQQSEEYRDSVLPPAITARVSIEEASTLGWDRYVGPDGATIGMHTFGSSAPLKDVQTKFGFTPSGRRDGARECSSGRATDEAALDEADPAAPRAGPEPVARQHHPRRCSTRGPSSATSTSSRSPGSPRTRRSSTRRSAGGHAYDEQIAELREQGLERRGPLLRARADRPAAGREPVRADQRAHRRVDGWVSLEVSPLLADDAEATIAQARSCTRGPTATSSSRSRAPRPGGPRSRSRSSPACR